MTEAEEAPVVHFENAERSGTVCGILYGTSGGWVSPAVIVTDPVEYLDVNCRNCLQPQ